MIELYHFWSSVCSVRCRMALEEKGVAWTSRYVDLFKFDQLRPEYLTINPDGVVPTLVHDGVPMRESTIINEYIDTAFEGPKLAVRPEGANHRWRRIPPGELSIDPVASERLGWVTGRAEASRQRPPWAVERSDGP